MSDIIKQAKEICPENWEEINELIYLADGNEEIVQELLNIQESLVLLLENTSLKRGKNIVNHYKRNQIRKCKLKEGTGK